MANKPKLSPVKPKPTPTPKVVNKNVTDYRGSIVEKVLPGKPGDLKKSMPSFLRKTKPVTRRGGK